MQEVKVFVKPPQSGKTRGSIIEPIINTFDEFVHVVVIPSCLNSQIQITSRMLEDIDRLDKSMISRFDSGSGQVKSESSWATSAYRINTGKVKVVVVLFNKKGKAVIENLLNLSKKRMALYFDEIHSFLSSANAKDFKEIVKKCKDLDYPVSGNTATVSRVCDANTDFAFVLVPMPVQPTYRGFHSLIIEDSGTMTQGEIYARIIDESPEGTTVMAHSGFLQIQHKNSREAFIRALGGREGAAVIVNSKGVTVHESGGRVIRVKPKLEMWQTLSVIKSKYKYLGIFGHTCMKESVTMQKCDARVNFPISHMVYVSEGADNTTRIQQVGRMFANDPHNNPRKLWISEAAESRLRRSVGVEEILLESLGAIDTTDATGIYFDRIRGESPETN